MAWPSFSDLKTELSDRGFAYLSDARLGRYVNQARTEIDEMELWPYRQATATGVAPLTISDLSSIESVWDSGGNRNLTIRDRRDLVDTYRDLTVTGTARWVYVEGSTVVRTYPVGGTLTVRYYKSTPDLSAAGDLPLLPTRYAYVIVDAAVRRAYQDDDNAAMAQAVQAEVDRALELMRSSLLNTETQDPSFMRVTAGSGGDW